MWYWGLMAGLAAVGLEAIYVRTGVYWSNLHWYIPVQVWLSYCIFRLVTYPSTTLVDAFIIFAFSTAALRIVTSLLVLHQHVTTYTWTAFALLVLARLIQLWGK